MRFSLSPLATIPLHGPAEVAGSMERIVAIHACGSRSCLVLRCDACGTTSEELLSSYAGVSFISSRCAQCGETMELLPEELQHAFRQLLPEFIGMTGAITLSEEASRITEAWYRVPPWPEAMDCDGINLGELMELEILAVVSSHLLTPAVAEDVD